MKLALPPLSQDKANALLLLGTCLLVLAPHMTRLPLWTSLFCMVLLLWRGWIAFRGNRMPPLWLLLPIGGAAITASLLTHKTFLGRDAGVTLLCLLLTIKLLEMRAKRDLFTVIFVCLFLVLANFFYTQSIAMTLLMGLTVVMLLTAQLSFQYTGTMPSLWQRARFGAMIAALATPLMLVLFVLFPRVSGPLWNLPDDARRTRTGLSEDMSPGDISQLAGSDEVAFRVAFLDPLPPRARLYWRGPVLGAFDGRHWRRLRQPARAQAQDAAGPPAGDAGKASVRWQGRVVRQVVTLEASGHRSLFALDLAQAPPLVPGMGSAMTAEFEVLASRPLDQRLRYEASSVTDFVLQPELGEAGMTPWLSLPRGFNPATHRYADHLRQTSDSPADMIDKVLLLFSRAPFRYTMSPPLLGRDGVDEFLFSTRAGFCEHYAGAFVVLMRAAGIPARVVTGYQGGEVNPVDGYLTVRQSDAHAWAEVWLAGQGWKRIDPTAAVAPERVEKNLASAIPPRAFGGLLQFDLGRGTVLGTLRNNWDAVTNQWNQWVLNYSADKQKDLLRAFGYREPDWRALVSLMGIVGSIVMALVAVPLLWRRQKMDPATALYEAFCRQHAARGLPRAVHEGPRAYGQRLATAHHKLAPSHRIAVAQFLALYEALQYAPAGTRRKADDIANLKTLLAQCR